MGCTKTLCGCSGPQDVALNLDELEEYRHALSKRASLYLNQPEYGAQNAPTSGSVALVVRLLDTYVALVSLRVKGALPDSEYLGSICTTAAVFSELWKITTRFSVGNSGTETSPLDVIPIQEESGLRESELQAITNAFPVPGEADSTINLAKVLAASYQKAYREFTHALSAGSSARIKHQAALLGDLLDEMQDIFRAFDFRDRGLLIRQGAEGKNSV